MRALLLLCSMLLPVSAANFSNLTLDRTVRADAFAFGQGQHNPPPQESTSSASGFFQFTGDVTATIPEGDARGRASQTSNLTVDDSLGLTANGEALLDLFIDPSVQHFTSIGSVAENHVELSFTIDQAMQYSAQVTWSRSGNLNPSGSERIGLTREGGAGSAVFLYEQPASQFTSGTLQPDDYLFEITFPLSASLLSGSVAGSITYDVSLTIAPVPEPGATTSAIAGGLALFCLAQRWSRSGRLRP